MKDTKNISLLLIPYLTVCGVVYHISYWDTFGLNGLSFISASDILKSAVYPIITSSLWIIPWALGHFEASRHQTVIDSDTILEKKWQQNLFFIVWLGLTNLIYFTNFYSKWQVFAFVASLLPTIYLFETNVLKSVITKSFDRLSFIFILIFLLTFSFSSGKYQSEKILKNQAYKYIKNIPSTTKQRMNTPNDILKFIGSTDKSLFFADLNNSTILIIKDSNIDSLFLYDKK